MPVLEGRSFYLFDTTLDRYVCPVTLMFPTVNETASNLVSAIESIMDAHDGQSTNMTDIKFSMLTSGELGITYNKSTAGLPQLLKNGTDEDNISDMEGFMTLSKLLRDLTSLGEVDVTHNYKLCVSKNNTADNYFIVKFKWREKEGTCITGWCLNGEHINLGVNDFIGIGFSTFYGYAFLNLSIITNDKHFVSFPLWTPKNDILPSPSFNITLKTVEITEEEYDKFFELFDLGQETKYQSDDPYAPAGYSEEGGGEGTFLDIGTNIDVPNLPSLSAVETHFITLYVPSLTELWTLCSYMWGNPAFDIDAWKKIFADPMDAILGLSIVPVVVPLGSRRAITVGNISTGVEMYMASTQYVTVDCGSINIPNYFGSYLDYEPFTKAEIYLPYCGTHAISTDDIMGKTVHVVYHVDVLSGACACYISCNDTVLYQYVGQCSASIPISGGDWTNMINGVMSVASSIGSMVASGGATAPSALGNIASTVVNSVKPNIQKSGAINGAGGMLAVQKPYLILTRPNIALPEYQNRILGYPAFVTRTLGDITGYNEIEDIRLEGISATDIELEEIETLLKSGVIL